MQVSSATSRPLVISTPCYYCQQHAVCASRYRASPECGMDTRLGPPLRLLRASSFGAWGGSHCKGLCKGGEEILGIFICTGRAAHINHGYYLEAQDRTGLLFGAAPRAQPRTCVPTIAHLSSLSSFTFKYRAWYPSPSAVRS